MKLLIPAFEDIYSKLSQEEVYKYTSLMSSKCMVDMKHNTVYMDKNQYEEVKRFEQEMIDKYK